MSLLSEFLKQADEGYMVIDREGILSYANEFLIKMGLLRQEWQGRHFYEVIKNLNLISLVSEAINERTSKSGHVYFEDKELSAKVFYTEEGLLVRVSDITPIKRYERSKREFVVNVSHELMTPLAVLKAILETLQDEELSDHARTLVEKALMRVEEMSQMVRDLLTIAKLESGEEKLEKHPIRLRDLVEDIFVRFEEMAKAERIELINEVDQDATLYADPEKMVTMLKNLVDNAIKYNKRGGKVVIRHRLEDRWDVVEVCDTGIGISKEDLPFVFDRFYRVDRSRSKDIPGTGLGLSIVKHIVLSHGGRVDVESKEGEGTVFRVFLPHIM